MSRVSKNILLFGMLWLAGCQLFTPDTEPAAEPKLSLDERLAQLGYQKMEAVDLIQRYDIHRWQYVDSQHLIVDSGPRRAFLVEFTHPCNRQDANEVMGYSDTLGRLTRQDRVFFRGTGGVSEFCHIRGFFKLLPLDKTLQ